MTEIAIRNKNKCLNIQNHEDIFFEHVFYHYSSKGKVELYNPRLNIKVTKSGAETFTNFGN